MSELTQEQIVRLYNVVDLTEREVVERAYLGDNTIEMTIRDTKTNSMNSFTLNLKSDLKTLDFILNGITLTREELC